MSMKNLAAAGHPGLVAKIGGAAAIKALPAKDKPKAKAAVAARRGSAKKKSKAEYMRQYRKTHPGA